MPFNHPVWEYVSIEAKELIKGLLHKDRFKRMDLQTVLTNNWVCKGQREVMDKRRKSHDYEKFEAYTATLASHITSASKTEEAKKKS